MSRPPEPDDTLSHAAEAAAVGLVRWWAAWAPVAAWAALAWVLAHHLGGPSWVSPIGALPAAVPLALWCWRTQLPKAIAAADERARRRTILDGLATVGLSRRDHPAEIVSVQLTPPGMAVEVRLPPPLTATDAARHAEALADQWEARDLAVCRARPGVVRLDLTVRDPLTEGPAPTWPLSERAWPRSLTKPLPVAWDQAGQIRTLDLWCSSVLIAGLPGSGKSSSALWPIALGAAMDPFAQLYVIDAKGGIEMTPLQAAGRLAGFVTDQASGVELLRGLLGVRNTRQEQLRALGLRKIPTDDPLFPPLVVIIDELAELTATGDRALDTEANQLLRQLLSTGRATGFTIVAATQKPSSDVVATGARDLFTWRWAMRTANRASAVVCLGEDAIAAGAAPEAIPRGDTHAGVGYLTSATGGADLVRGFHLDDQTITELAGLASAWQTKGLERATWLRP